MSTTILSSALIVTANEMFGAALQKKLSEHGCRTMIVQTEQVALEACRQALPDMVLVEREHFLPHMASVIATLRGHPLMGQIPLVTVADPQRVYAEEDCIQDLDAGCDGCLCNLTFRQIVAYARAILRTIGNSRTPRPGLEAEGITIDVARHEVRVGETLVELTPREFMILRVFLERPRMVLSRQELLDYVWGKDYALEEHVLDVHIHALRRKIERDSSKPARLVTVRGVGYKLQTATSRPVPDHRPPGGPIFNRDSPHIPPEV